MANKSVVLYQSIKIGNKWVLRPVDEDSSHFSVGPFYVGWYDGKKKHVGLNKGEQQNALRRAVFFNRLGEIRDRSYENQRHRASGLNLLVAAIILWNSVYLQRAVDYLGKHGHHPEPTDLAHLSPLGWEHINLTGDYHWESSPTLGQDQFRPLRTRSHDPAMAA